MRMGTWSKVRSVALVGLMSAGLAAAVATPTLAAGPTNLVTNPSGAGGKTTGWALSYNGNQGSLQAVTKGGTSWLEYKSTLSEGGGVWVLYPLTMTTAGTKYTCGFEAEGSGTIYADAYDGAKDNQSSQVTLSATTPKQVDITFTVVNPSGAQIQVRYNTPPVDVYFNDVTCVPGSSVTLVASTSATTSSGSASTSSGTTSSSTSSKTSTSSTSSKTSTSGATSGSTSLPKTGGSPLMPIVGGVLAISGVALLSRRRKS